MNQFDVYGGHSSVTLLAPAEITATANGSGVDLLAYAGKAIVTLCSTIGTGTSPTLAVKLQDSADNSSFADVSGATFTQVTDAAASVQTIGYQISENRRYVRVVSTAGGTTPSFYTSVTMVALKEQNL